MAKVEVILPAMGEGIIEAEITRWLVTEGTLVTKDQSVVEVATDKVDSEIPAPETGALHKILLKEGDIPKVGQVLAVIETDVENDMKSGEPVPAGIQEEPVPEDKPSAAGEIIATGERVSDTKEKDTALFFDHSAKAFLSPVVKKIIKENQIPAIELRSIIGTGAHGRITIKDVENYLLSRKPEKSNSETPPPESTTGNQTKPAAEAISPISREQLYGNAAYEVFPMDRMRKLIADRMVYSKRISPHVTSFVEIDVSDLVYWRNSVKADFEKKYKEKLTFTPLFIEAVAKAIKDYPLINISVDHDKIIVKQHINIGIATALPDGNLIVPVIKNADKMSLQGLSATVNDLTHRARNQQLKPYEIQGSTFTVTNVGSFGNITGTPIINQPEVAILAVGAIKKKPAVVETTEGDAIGIRHIMILSLTYDHRVVDGALGGMFLKKTGDYLETFETSRKI